MSAIAPPVDAILPPATQADDVDGLAAVFHDRYPELLREAEGEVGDPVTASPVVERAFLAAWERRTELTAPGALDAFLHDAVHRGSVRERSRRAAVRRLEAHEGARHPASTASHAPGGHAAPSVDDAWARVASALLDASSGTRAAEHAAAHAAADEALRHRAAEHLAGVARQPSWRTRAALALPLLGLAVAGLWLVDRAGDDAAVARALASTDARVVSTKSGQRATLTLDDGSTVVLGPGTQLRIVPRFGTPLRAVALDGTASFTVAPGAERPFEVRSGDASIVALGTAFTVRGYADEGVLTVGVREGEVRVTTGKASHVVAAGHALTSTGQGVVAEPSAAARAEALAWADGRFIVTGRPVREVLPRLKRWFALDLTVDDATLLERPVTMTATLDSARGAITALEASAGVWLAFDGKRMVLRDSSTKPAPRRGAAKRR